MANQIEFRDFVPECKEPGGFFKMPAFEPLSAALAHANAWISENGIDVINVETVVLPNMRLPTEDGPEDVALRVSGEMSSLWNQFIRVWFRPR